MNFPDDCLATGRIPGQPHSRSVSPVSGSDTGVYPPESPRNAANRTWGPNLDRLLNDNKELLAVRVVWCEPVSV